jgi:hypothetical protein
VLEGWPVVVMCWELGLGSGLVQQLVQPQGLELPQVQELEVKQEQLQELWQGSQSLNE